jgi:hypothetical protein
VIISHACCHHASEGLALDIQSVESCNQVLRNRSTSETNRVELPGEWPLVIARELLAD